MVLKSEADRADDLKKARIANSRRAAAVLGWIGLGFLAVGGLDFLLAWYPTAFESKEWQFAVATRSFGSLPVPTMGIGFLVFASVLSGRRWWAYLGGAAAALVGFVVVVGVVLWATNVPLALSQVPDEVATGMYRSITRTAVQSVVYPLLMIYLAVTGIRFGGAIQSGE